MAKVVLIWNEHPTEVVAGFHARKVAAILRKSPYNHEVIMEKIPFPQTNLGVARKSIVTEEDERNISMPSVNRAQEMAKKHGVLAFNFHCSRPEAMGSAKIKEPNEFKLKEYTEPRPLYEVGFGQPAEITIVNEKRDERGFVIEMPAFYITPKKPLAKRQVIDRVKAEKKLSEWIKDRSKPALTPEESLGLDMINPFLGSHYYKTLTPLRHPEQQKYLHPAISEKIAAAIHERITKRK